MPIAWSPVSIPSAGDLLSGAVPPEPVQQIFPSGIAGEEAFGDCSVAVSTAPPLTGLVQWFDGRAVAYSDAGVTVAAVPYGRIAQIAQPAPLSGNWTATGTARPVREVNGADFRNGEQSRLVGPALAAATPANGHTIALSIEIKSPSNESTVYRVADPGGGVMGISTFSHGVYYYLNNAGKGPLLNFGAIATSLGPLRLNLLMSFTPTGQTWEGDLDGVPFSGSDGNIPSVGNLGGPIQLGGTAGRGVFSGSQFLVYNQILAGTPQGDDVLAFLQDNTVGLPPDSAPFVTFAGDSICVGGGIPNAYENLVNRTQLALVGNPTQPRFTNPAFVGASIANMAALHSTYYVPMYSASRAKNILVWQVATNSLNCNIGAEAATAAAGLAQLYAACDLTKALGYLNILCTVLHSSHPSKGTGFEGTIAIFNPDIIANHMAHGAAYCDFAAQPGMSTLADCAGPNFQPDGLHVSAVGYSVMAPALTAVIAGLL